MSESKPKHYSFFYRNGLSIVVLTIMLIFIFCQYYFGWLENNHDRAEDGLGPVPFISYYRTGHFISALFENWESEFFQMGFYVVLTIKLRQIGSSESKKLEGKEEVDREPVPRPDAPWPVRKGGFWLKIYQHSLSIAFFLLFIISFSLHLYGSLKSFNEAQLRKGEETLRWFEYLSNSRFWFESFQNWQSEFLAVAAIVLLSIWLRQKGSPQSKPVDAPYFETGE